MRCAECGQFTKETVIIYTGMPMPEPDHYACLRCAGHPDSEVKK